MTKIFTGMRTVRALRIAALAVLCALHAGASGKDVASVRGYVTFSDRERIVVVSDVKAHSNGRLIRLVHEDGTRAVGPTQFQEGERIIATGIWMGEGKNRELVAGSVTKKGRVKLDEPNSPKASDLRRGYLHLRRVRIAGTLGSIDFETDQNGDVRTYLGIHFPQRKLHAACIHADASKLGLEPRCKVEIKGVVFNVFDANGVAIGTQIEVAGLENVRVLEPVPPDMLKIGGVALIILLSVSIAALAAAWARARRKRRELEVIVAERKRIAGELHDNLEQHFAGAKILIAGALRVKDVPDSARTLLRQAAQVMANAKVEVRDAVLDLRSDDMLKLAPVAAMRSLASRLAATGAARVRTRLEALPEKLAGCVQRDLLSIVREAVTNAIKHGHAKNIAIVADPADRGFILRVMNDGEPFNIDEALGPETAHFGLAGMRERAVRSGMKISFGTKGRWTGVRIEIGGAE